MDSSDVHLLNELLPTVVTESGMVIDVIEVQLANVPSLIVSRELPNVMDSSDVQPQKASIPKLVTVLGIVIDVMDVHPLNAL